MICFHAITVALSAALLRLRGLSVTLGVGPRIADLGYLQLRALPLGSHISIPETHTQTPPPHYPSQVVLIWAQIWLPLVGAVFTIALGFLILGNTAGPSFIDSFGQFGQWAISPLTQGPAVLNAFDHYVLTHTSAQVFALIGIKLCALIMLGLALGSLGLGLILSLQRFLDGKLLPAVFALGLAIKVVIWIEGLIAFFIIAYHYLIGPAYSAIIG